MFDNERVNSIEQRIARFVCYVGIVRVIYSLINDFINQREPIVFVISFTILALIVALFIIISSKKYFKIGVFLFSILLTIALSLNWVMFGGIGGRDSFNFLLWVAVVVVINTGQLSRVYAVILAVIVVVMMITQSAYPEIFQSIYIRNSTGFANYLFALGGTLAIVYYLKNYLNSESIKLHTRDRQIQTNIKVSENQKHQLLEERAALKELQERLERKVEERSIEVNKKSEAIKDYLQLNLIGLKKPIELIDKKIKKVSRNHENDELFKLLSMSSEELSKVTKVIKKNIEDGNKIKREIIERS